jgi:hypothetical protein
MRLVPKDINGAIDFFNVHAQFWAQDPGAIGTTPERVAELQARVAAAREAHLAQRQMQDAARSATIRLQLALDEMKDLGTTIVQEVRAKAAVDGPEIFVDASLPLPRKGSPIGEPGTPKNFSFQLDAIGALMLKWDCDHPRGAVGTMYRISRRIGWNGPFTFIGLCGKKSFNDDTLPAGVAMATYEIVAYRSTKTGSAGVFMVCFGGAGGMPAGMQVAA